MGEAGELLTKLPHQLPRASTPYLGRFRDHLPGRNFDRFGAQGTGLCLQLREVTPLKDHGADGRECAVYALNR